MSVKTSTLKNGLRVVTETNPHVETLSLGIWVDVGARYETEQIHGISHLLEHMIFKGTKTRTAIGIAEEIEDVGGHLNAYTSREHTSYYSRVLKEDVELAMDILADILLNSQFPEDELKREQEVVLQEIGQVQDTPDDLIFDHLQMTAFPNQALGKPILGTVETVSSFTRASLQKYMTSHYHSGNMILVGVGNVGHERFKELAEKYFATLKSRPKNVSEKAKYNGGEFRDVKDLEQLHVALGFESTSYRDPDFFAAQLYTSILGGGMSSRLFQEVREKRGLSYSVYAFNAVLKETGLLSIYAGTGAEHINELLSVVGGEMKSLANDIPEEELSRAKAQLKTALLTNLESTSGRSEQMARHMLIFDRVIPTTELVEKTNAVDKTALNRVARKILKSPITLAGIGRMNGMPVFDKIQERFQD
ncbi:MAG: pitrilysin family protein [Sphingomonadales bacterium]